MPTIPTRFCITALSFALATLSLPNHALSSEQISDSVHPYQEGLAGIYLSNKWGFVDKSGKVVIAPQFDEVSDFQHGLAAVQKGDQAFFIDQTGKTVLAGPYKHAEGFNGKSAIVTLPSGKLALIDLTGKVISEASQEVSRWYNTRSPDRFMGLRSKQLKRLTADGKTHHFERSDAFLLSEASGLFAFFENNHYGLMDINGKILAPAIYDRLTAANKQRLITVKNELFGLMDVNGKEILPNTMHSISEFSDGLAQASPDGEHSGLINQEGQWVVKPTLSSQITIVSPTIYSYPQNNKTIFKNIQGTTIAEASGYASLQLLGNKLAILHTEDPDTGNSATRLISEDTGQNLFSEAQLPGDPKQYRFTPLFDGDIYDNSRSDKKLIGIQIAKLNAEAEEESVGLYLPTLGKFYPPIWKAITSGYRDGLLTIDMNEDQAEKVFLLNTSTGELSARGAYFISGYENKKNSKYITAYAADSKYGVMDLASNWVIQPQFEKVMIGEGDQLVAAQNGYNQWQILDLTGKPVWPETFEDVSRPDGDTLFARKNKQLVLLKAGQPPKLLDNDLYLLATQFGEFGSIPARKRGVDKIALLDKNGTWLTGAIFDDLRKEDGSPYYRQTRIVDGRYFYGLVDGQGKEILPARFTSLELMQESFFVGCNNNECQLFNLQGKEINPQIHFDSRSDLRPISYAPANGKARIYWAHLETNEGSWFINSEGQSFFLDDVFEDLFILPDQSIAFNTRQTQAIFDASGKQLTPWGDQVDDLGDIIMWQQYDKRQVYNKDGQLNAPLSKRNQYISWVGEGRFQTTDDDGNYTLETLTGERYPLPKGTFIYSDSSHAEFVDGLAITMPAHGENAGAGYVNSNGKWVIAPKFGYGKNFSEGKALVTDRKSHLFGFIDKTGKTVIPFQFNTAQPFSNGMAAVNEKGREDISLIDSDGKVQFRISNQCGNNVLTDSRGTITWKGKPCVNFIERKLSQ